MMSETSIFSKEEFLKRAELAAEELSRWMKRGLMLAAGKTAGGEPYFTKAQLEVVAKIRTLLELGYDESGIEKIVRKVGLPAPEKGDLKVPQKLMTIGDLAQLCHINTRAINHWEEKGLLDPEARSEGGFRLYGPASVKRCKRILDLQNVGYTLEQIRSMSQLLADPQSLATEIKQKLRKSDLQTWEEQDERLKTRIGEVRVSVKRLEDLWKQRTRLLSGLKAQYARLEREAKKKSPKPAPAKA